MGCGAAEGGGDGSGRNKGFFPWMEKFQEGRRGSTRAEGLEQDGVEGRREDGVPVRPPREGGSRKPASRLPQPCVLTWEVKGSTS